MVIDLAALPDDAQALRAIVLAQAAALVALGCRHAQGYLLSRPVPPERLPVRVEVPVAVP